MWEVYKMCLLLTLSCVCYLFSYFFDGFSMQIHPPFITLSKLSPALVISWILIDIFILNIYIYIENKPIKQNNLIILGKSIDGWTIAVFLAIWSEDKFKFCKKLFKLEQVYKIPNRLQVNHSNALTASPTSSPCHVSCLSKFILYIYTKIPFVVVHSTYRKYIWLIT